MTLTNPAKRRKPGNAAQRDRDTLVTEIVDEMTAWSPKDRMSAFRSWLKGSLSLIHLHVLTMLEADGPIPMSKLADRLDVSVASATGIITRMEERGLVERRHGETDRRVVLVGLTSNGTAVFRDLGEERRKGLRSLLERLTKDDLEALLAGMRALRTAREALHREHAAAEGKP